MKPTYYFDMDVDFKKVGDDVDYSVIVFPEDKSVILYFQCTHSIRDWINNFRFPCKIYKKQESCMLVARGWGDAYKSCNDTVMSEFISDCSENPTYTPLIIGYSYGGAMAQIASEDFFYRTKIKPNVITFGSPKPFFGKRTQTYVTSCCNEVRQYSHVYDIVTKVPPFYRRLRTDSVGKWKCLFSIFNPQKYHTIYGDETLYSN